MKWLIVVTLVASFAAVSHGAEMSGKSAPAAAASAEAPAPEPKLDGVVIKRGDGTYLTVTMEGPVMALKFFDQKKAPKVADVTTGVVRFVFSGRRPEHRALALSADGKSMLQVRPFHPPFVFKAFITLSRSENDPNPETYTVDYP